ncbi:MFS transporter [Schaalia sp. lx-260]|uniref:MFS transporter n=1 Tax=Schaalia sp. lx-260 TaxID=2899082 RepID=UPI001E4303A5|nr:MFS transporter [Schaalia sp. lx-260]MCD4549591.1 MFS transporter [Schaalia sp. lx-260]
MRTEYSKRSLSMFIAASGTIIEWFDYSLFFYLAMSLSHTFYPEMDSSLLIVLGTGSVGFLFRPLGAVVFGHIGDAKGRTVSLVISAGLMSLSMLGIALMPGYDTIGIWGGVAVLLLRALAGFSVGAEYTGIMVYLMESARPHRRALTASWAAANSEIGALLAVGSSAITTSIVGSAALNTWAWRIPFICGAILAAIMLPLRKFMVESPAMHKKATEMRSEIVGKKEGPLTYVLRHQRRSMLVTFLISTVGSATYFLTITYLPTYIETVDSGDSQMALNYGIIAAVSAILVTPFFGLLSDLIGRRRSFTVLLVAVITLAIPGYSLLTSPNILVLAGAVAVLAIPAAGWSAAAASAIPEQFPTQGRYSGMAIGYNLATVIFGGLTPPLVTWLIQSTGHVLAPAFYASAVAIIAGIPAIILMGDTVKDQKRK